MYALVIMIVNTILKITAKNKHKQEKKKKYLEAVQTRHATFSPFVVSVDGVLGREANVLIKRLAEKIAYKWESS